MANELVCYVFQLSDKGRLFPAESDGTILVLLQTPAGHTPVKLAHDPECGHMILVAQKRQVDVRQNGCSAQGSAM